MRMARLGLVHLADQAGPRARLLSSKPKKPPTPSIPDATTVFKMSNPELMLDPNKRASWKIVGGVVAFFTVYLSYTAYKEGLFADAGQSMSAEYATEKRHEANVQKILPDGRLLMRDGSIVRPPPT